ncbi:MAG: hypothetical protein IPH50_15255 [Rhodanobacteraceae bacterium]|nr:hypothetical protein [Rhodanobacteraceae bacterium]
MAHVFAPGLVLYMYPDELVKHGAECTADTRDAVTAQHYFVCLEVDARAGLWTPLFQGSGRDLKMISEAAKSGHARWTRGPSFYDVNQLWRVPHKAAQRAAAAANDASLPKSPNLVVLTALPQRADFPADDAFLPG